MVPALFFDWFARLNRKLVRRRLGDGGSPIENRNFLLGVFWILPLVGVRRCLSRVVGLSLNPLRNK